MAQSNPVKAPPSTFPTLELVKPPSASIAKVFPTASAGEVLDVTNFLKRNKEPEFVIHLRTDTPPYTFKRNEVLVWLQRANAGVNIELGNMRFHPSNETELLQAISKAATSAYYSEQTEEFNDKSAIPNQVLLEELQRAKQKATRIQDLKAIAANLKRVNAANITRAQQMQLFAANKLKNVQALTHHFAEIAATHSPKIMESPYTQAQVEHASHTLAERVIAQAQELIHTNRPVDPQALESLVKNTISTDRKYAVFNLPTVVSGVAAAAGTAVHSIVTPIQEQSPQRVPVLERLTKIKDPESAVDFTPETKVISHEALLKQEAQYKATYVKPLETQIKEVISAEDSPFNYDNKQVKAQLDQASRYLAERVVIETGKLAAQDRPITKEDIGEIIKDTVGSDPNCKVLNSVKVDSTIETYVKETIKPEELQQREGKLAPVLEQVTKTESPLSSQEFAQLLEKHLNLSHDEAVKASLAYREFKDKLPQREAVIAAIRKANPTYLDTHAHVIAKDTLALLEAKEVTAANLNSIRDALIHLGIAETEATKVALRVDHLINHEKKEASQALIQAAMENDKHFVDRLKAQLQEGRITTEEIVLDVENIHDYVIFRSKVAQAQHSDFIIVGGKVVRLAELTHEMNKVTIPKGFLIYEAGLQRALQGQDNEIKRILILVGREDLLSHSDQDYRIEELLKSYPEDSEEYHYLQEHYDTQSYDVDNSGLEMAGWGVRTLLNQAKGWMTEKVGEWAVQSGIKGAFGRFAVGLGTKLGFMVPGAGQVLMAIEGLKLLEKVPGLGVLVKPVNALIGKLGNTAKDLLKWGLAAGLGLMMGLFGNLGSVLGFFGGGFLGSALLGPILGPFAGPVGAFIGAKLGGAAFNALNGLGGALSHVKNGLQSVLHGSTGGGVGTIIASAPIYAVAGTAIGGIYTMQLLASAFVLPPFGTVNSYFATLPQADSSCEITDKDGKQVQLTIPETYARTWPILRGTVTAGPFTTREQPTHVGVNAMDIGVPIGTPILATHNGVIEEIGDANDGYGKKIVISGKNGDREFRTLYGHMSTIVSRFPDGSAMKIGAVVMQGWQIGSSGNTGNSTGPHLHYQIIDKWTTIAVTCTLPSLTREDRIRINTVHGGHGCIGAGECKTAVKN